MANRKTVTPQTFIGEKGIAMIERRCLDMGYLFHPRRVDHGIDGHIDLVDPNDGALLNLVLLVQSKASNRPFINETGDAFEYLCDDRDLDLWLSGNAPVLVIFSHPDDDLAWWIDVKSAFPTPEVRATRRLRVDKRTQSFGRDTAPRLISLALPTYTGLYLQPPPKRESLETNLLSVDSFPPVIYSALSVAADYQAAGDILREHDLRTPGWMLRHGRVYSFADVSDAALQPLCTGPVDRIDSASWAHATDLPTTFDFMDLLTRTLQQDHHELRWHNARKHLHYRATPDLQPRKAGRGPRSHGRTFFGPHYSKSDPARVSYYHHAAVRLRFRRFGSEWYCQIEPDYCFTWDGRQESSFAESLLAGIKRFDRHPAVAGWTRAWVNLLTRPPDLFRSAPLVRLSKPVTVEVDRGIDDRWWGPAPVDAMVPDEPADAGPRFDPDDLATADVDAEDLFSLVNDDQSAEAPVPAARARRRRPGSSHQRSVPRDES